MPSKSPSSSFARLWSLTISFVSGEFLLDNSFNVAACVTSCSNVTVARPLFSSKNTVFESSGALSVVGMYIAAAGLSSNCPLVFSSLISLSVSSVI